MKVITKPTALVVGAGASMDYGFPSGAQLRHDICYGILRVDLHRSDTIFGLLRLVGFPKDRVLDFAGALNESQIQSVDEFLDYQRGFADVGKAAIAAALIPYERLVELIDRLNAVPKARTELPPRIGHHFRRIANRTVSRCCQ